MDRHVCGIGLLVPQLRQYRLGSGLAGDGREGSIITD